ncbi:potassium transporter [Microthyrium microscopicum]|uniref:Potassium transporter n=1 Tax=Microthyrium microscopicum TaxID=703497 RepID=A0A6A6U122_9PEZI|nr:potassium transporter [Microthyrium microscopicum]
MADKDGARNRVITKATTDSTLLGITSTSKDGKMIDPDVESVADNDIPDVRDSDIKRKQVFSGWQLWWLAYQSTGVIYGDIGTSPLYVYSSTFSSNPSYDDILGALSLIIWTLTLIVTIKYVLIVLWADDAGEGGTFAMYQLLSRYCNIIRSDPKSVNTIRMERYKSTDLRKTNLSIRTFLENSNAAHLILKLTAVLGVSLIMADGLLTPAQSVLGAIQGLEVVHENITKPTIIGSSCGILVLLFSIQPLGITKLSSTFAPIVMIWLIIFNFGFGIYNIAKYDHSVLKAFSPYYAGLYFVRYGTEGWKSLGGILLAFTGVEALFADIGAFSAKAVRISWLSIAYPCLLVAYIGQAAYISVDPSAYSNPFFKTVPKGTLYPSLVIAVLAAVVASQALITSTFQLLAQVMNSSYFPHITMIYTSDKFHGQVYIPIANWVMLVGTVIVTAVYNNTTSLGNAYGFCVILVSFITTNMVSIVAIVVWRLHWTLVLALWLPFATLDGLYLSAAATKIPDGAWFTLILGLLLSSLFVLWRYGKENQWKAERSGPADISALVTRAEDGSWTLPGGRSLTTIKGIAIFFDKAGEGVPNVYEEFLRKFEALPDIQVFLHMRALARPYVEEDEKFEIMRTSLPNAYRIIVRHGYNDVVVTEGLGDLVYAKLKQFILSTPMRCVPNDAAVSTSISFPEDSSGNSAQQQQGLEEKTDVRVERRLTSLEAAFEAQTIYMVGKEQMRLVKAHNNILKRAVLSVFLWVRDNTRAKVASMRIPVDKLVEVGFVKEI